VQDQKGLTPEVGRLKDDATQTARRRENVKRVILEPSIILNVGHDANLGRGHSHKLPTASESGSRTNDLEKPGGPIESLTI